MTLATDAVSAHVEAFFEAHLIHRLRERIDGPIYTRVPNFEVVVVEPGPRLELWTYVSLGCWDSVHDEHGHGSEFILIAPASNDRNILSLAMNAHSHAGPPGQQLGHGHTVPIGEPWLDGSGADHLLLSKPYPLGSEVEWCSWDGGHAQLLWLLPITRAERDYKVANGLEALEARFDEAAMQYWEPLRASVI